MTQDWVPRWGKDSIKKIEEKHNWLMPDKPKYAEAGMDPFTYARAEKKAKKEGNLGKALCECHNTQFGKKGQSKGRSVSFFERTWLEKS